MIREKDVGYYTKWRAESGGVIVAVMYHVPGSRIWVVYPWGFPGGRWTFKTEREAVACIEARVR